MRRDQELLDFEVDSATGVVSSVRVLDESSLAQGIQALPSTRGKVTPESLARDVQYMIRRRSIHSLRIDLPNILRATGTGSPVELALGTHGLSLSDLYWYRSAGSRERWADVNFFDNGWDASFGEAVLRSDWDALSRADREVPDVTCDGWARKAWVRKGGAAYLLKGSHAYDTIDLVGELLAARMLSRILGPFDYVHYEKVRRFGEDYIACPAMLRSDEELVPASELLESDKAWERDDASIRNSLVLKNFADVLANLGVKNARQAVSKELVAVTLTLNRDLHLANFGVIHNVETGTNRASPLYDFGGAFCLGVRADVIERAIINPEFALLWMLRDFSELDPSWDYSWYNPRALEGFGEELEATLDTVEGIPKGYPKLVRQAFELQLGYVNETAEKSAPCLDLRETESLA